LFIAFGVQDHLGDVVFVELPEVGISVSQGKNFGAVESVKATSDINSPVSGEVVEVNEKLSEEPGLVSVATNISQNSSENKLPWVD
jgi:glycine cleavage system H protein